MDAYALLDHTLMHELTHAIPVRPTDDVAGKASYGRCQRGTISPLNALVLTSW